jgi:hypothetical protein
MLSTINVKIAKLDTLVAFEPSKLPEASLDYLLAYGATQAVNDAAASVVRKNFDTDEAFEEAVREKTQKRVDQIESGDVPGTRAPASPAKKLGNQVAAAVVAAGLDPATIDIEKLSKYLARMAEQGRAA